MPTLHFDLLSCTACHSGPAPSNQATLVQTAMAHKLGLPRHHTADAAAPTIQQPVFLRDEKTGKLAPYRVLYASYWGRLAADGSVAPLLPEQVLAAGVDAILGRKADPKKFEPLAPLSEEQIAQVLEKLAAAPPPTIKPADVITARSAPTTAPAAGPATMSTATTTGTATAAAAATQPSTSPSPPAWTSGEPVFITGMKAYKRGAGGKLETFFHIAASPYAWPLAHDVRPAQQSLGARGCVECHAAGAPIFDGVVQVATLAAGPAETKTMHQGRMDSMGALRAFAATYPLRWPLIVIGYASAAVVLLVLMKQAMRAMGSSPP
jgi:hypothetical protein